MIDRLAAAHRQGRLVPFLGAGMSVPACPGWGGFVEGLERQAFESGRGAPGTGSDSEALIRRANGAVRQLRLRGEPPFAVAVSQALKVDPPPEAPVPAQTRALAKLYWPLVLTSNYDGIFLKAWNDEHAGTGSEMEAVGRSPADCRQVLTSLNASRPPILWALQGYVGELSGASSRQVQRFLALDEAGKKLMPDPAASTPEVGAMPAKAFESFKRAMETAGALAQAKRRELNQQLVVGHEEYRRVTHTEPQFRRAFAEVFRSRSLLFVGSSLSDQYLLNLFGETLEIFGANPFAHYAFVLKGTTDPHFLRTRLNTFVHEYESHQELPPLLEELHDAVEDRSARIRVWSYAVAAPNHPAGARGAADLHVIRGELPPPEAGECVALGVSVGEGGRVTLEPAAKRVIETLGGTAQVTALAFGPNDRVLRVSDRPLFLVAMTRGQSRQDLRQYAQAVGVLLEAVAATEFRMLRTRLPLRDATPGWLGLLMGRAGRLIPQLGLLQQLFSRDFRQRFWLMEIIRAYGRWRRTDGRAKHLELSVHLTDPGILFDMSTGRIDPLELLMCDDLRFSVEVEHDASTLIAESYHREGTVTLGTLAQELRILRAADAGTTPERWLIEVEPSPTGVPHVLPLSSTLDMSLAELGVVTDSILRFVRVAKAVEPAKAPRAAPPTVSPTSPGPTSASTLELADTAKAPGTTKPRSRATPAASRAGSPARTSPRAGPSRA